MLWDDLEQGGGGGGGNGRREAQEREDIRTHITDSC